MATLQGKTPKNSFKDLLQVSNGNLGVDETLRPVEDGEGTETPLQLSTEAVNVEGIFMLNGVPITVEADEINALATQEWVLQILSEFPSQGGGGVSLALVIALS